MYLSCGDTRSTCVCLCGFVQMFGQPARRSLARSFVRSFICYFWSVFIETTAHTTAPIVREMFYGIFDSDPLLLMFYDCDAFVPVELGLHV